MMMEEDIELLFNKIGITLREANGSFKTAYNVLKDMSQKWNLIQEEVLVTFNNFMATPQEVEE